MTHSKPLSPGSPVSATPPGFTFAQVRVLCGATLACAAFMAYVVGTLIAGVFQ